MKKVFFDTAPVIYLIESHPANMPKVVSFLSDCIRADTALATSVVTFAEFGVQPTKQARTDILDAFHEFLADFNFEYLPVDDATARKSLELRSHYPFLKLADAFQLGAALVSGCDTLLTNDRQLRQVRGIRIITVDDLASI